MRALLCCALLASGCVPQASVAPAPAAVEKSTQGAPKTLEYVFELDRDLETLAARVCPTGAVPARLVPGMRAARRMLASAAIERNSERIALTATERGLDLQQLQPGDCVRYELDLRYEGGGFGAQKVQRSGASIMANLAALLWRPVDYADYAKAHARILVPEGVQVSVPWPRDPSDPQRYQLDASAFAFHGYAAFGALTLRELRIAGSAIELAMLDGLSQGQELDVEQWAKTQVAAASLLADRLPRERIQIVVLPTGPSSDPIRFGSMTRGGGASAGVLIATDFDSDALIGDWVLVHELSHLLHPFVKREEAWLSEGIATYYQEVLRARGGLQPADRAWGRILSGSEQGEEMDMSLERGAATMYETYRFAPVYWGGAAVMLMADVELRSRSLAGGPGPSSLDEVLTELSSCCSEGSRPWTASEVAERFDAIAGAPIMRELIERVVRGESFPELNALYAQLGVDSEGQPIAGAPLASVRDDIMRADRPVGPLRCLRAEAAGGTTPPP